MVAVPPLPPAPLAYTDEDGSRFLLKEVTWDQYVNVRRILDERPGLRMTFYEGDLELMSPSRPHEAFKTIIARLLEAWALARRVRIHGFGSETMQNPVLERALEPDECYYFGPVEGPPHIALEVALSSGGTNKLAVYLGLGVREVWFWTQNRIEVHALGINGYERIPRSRVAPELDLAELARFALMEDQGQAVEAWFDLHRTSGG